MRQTTLCVPLEVRPESCSRLSALVDDLRRQEDSRQTDSRHADPEKFGPQGKFAGIKNDVPTLHFMSMSVFTSADYDPMFILEANFDGPAGIFWGQLEAAFSDDLRQLLRCCKRPLNEDGPLYDAVTARASRAPVAPYFEARTQRPSVFHHGNRGMTRDRILGEEVLFRAVRDELGARERTGPSPYRGISPSEVHGKLRRQVLSTHPWLDETPPDRFPKGERILDVLRLLLFAVVLLLVLSLPGLVLALLVHQRTTYVLLVVGAALLIGLLIYRKRQPLPGTGIETKFSLVAFLLGHAPLIVGCVLGYVVVATLLPALILAAASPLLVQLDELDQPLGFGGAFWAVAPTILWGLLSLVVTVPLIILWLRYRERRDSSLDAPHVNERLLREMIKREDWVAQNHMGSLLPIRSGVLRATILHAGHLGLGLLLRVVAREGYLGSMRTVHFAHWAFLNNDSRLLFFSNFDHSWDSYLDDFIEKAHVGLTLAWGCGVGFPPTRFLIYDGASHGRQFKNWALASRAVSRFWYSAYPALTVDQIERNYRVANGLRRPSLIEKEALEWMRDL